MVLRDIRGKEFGYVATGGELDNMSSYSPGDKSGQSDARHVSAREGLVGEDYDGGIDIGD